jgi:uncharacterized protein YhaN
MKLLRLDLIAFGPFCEQSLNFGDGNGLHIVHGRNEAGKSSSLRALRHLLYGIPTRCDDAFVHAYPNLRIGGVFEAGDGSRLEFIRRKANTKTLRGPDDAAIFDEDQLQRLLAGVDEETFRQRFGIDYAELRRGGQAVVEGGGDLKEILFAAGAGVADLRTIQQQLDQEGDSLFKPRGSTQRISQALSELQSARKAIKEAQLPTADWVEHDTALQQAQERLEEIDRELTSRRTERSRLLRVHDSLPLIGQLKPVQQKLAQLVDAPLLPEEFSADRREAETQLETARRDAQLARDAISRLDEQLAAVEVPADLLEHRTAIEQLHTDLGSYRKAAADLPGLVARRNAARQRAGEILRQLGRPLRLDQAESLRVPKAQKKRILDLANDCKALVERKESSEAALQKIDTDQQNVTAQIAAIPPARDAADLERTIQRTQRHGDLDAQLQRDQEQLTALDEQARVALARLPLFSKALDDLERLQTPTAETIERFENELADAQQDVRRCREKIDELTAAHQQTQSKLDALRLEGEVPTEADLTKARIRRDAGWELVQHTWRDGAPHESDAAAQFIAEFAAGGDLVQAFRASIELADQLADRLRREAGRVAEKAQLTADLQRTVSDLAHARDRLAAAEQQAAQVQQQWEAQWASAGISPLTPREMRPWRTRWQQLVDHAADLRTRRTGIEQLAARIDALRTQLNESLKALDCPPVPDDTPLSGTLEICLQTAAQIRDQTQQRQRLDAEQRRLQEQRAQVEQQTDQAGRKLTEWRQQWAEAVASLGLDADARPDEADAVIDDVEDMLSLLDEARSLDDRITGIDKDATRFRSAVQQLLAGAAPDLLQVPDAPVEQTVSHLVDRLAQARTDQTRVAGWQEQLQQQQARLKDAQVSVTRWQQALEKLCEQAGCTAPEQLPQAEQRSRERSRAEAELQSLQQRLCELAAGADLEKWIADVEEFDSDQVQADLTALNESIDQLETHKQQVSIEIGEHRNELSHMDGSGRAAEACFHADHLLASVRNHAEEYIRLRLASAVLSRAMERFRQASQGPVLERAAELFTTLTLGSFTGLRPDYDTAGNAVLVGVRPDGPTGPTVPTSGMSDGTCDQLYLALRIALLESCLEGREPLPFIVDDILIMFDDARAAAALNVLSRLAEKTQVIFFTHHAHLVTVAREVLESEAHIHELRGSTPPVLA